MAQLIWYPATTPNWARNGVHEKPLRLKAPGGKLQGHEGTHREDAEDQQEAVGEVALEAVDEVVADERHHEGHDGDDDDPEGLAAVDGRVEGLAGQDRVEDVEAGVLQVGEEPHEQRSHVPELRPRLDHLREPELGSLRGVERHEEGPDEGSAHDGDQRPQDVAAAGDADQPDRERGDLGVAHEPQRSQIGQLAVPLVQRHVVDGADFHPTDACGRTLLGHGVPLSRRPRVCRPEASVAPAPQSGTCTPTYQPFSLARSAFVPGSSSVAVQPATGGDLVAGTGPPSSAPPPDPARAGPLPSTGRHLT